MPNGSSSRQKLFWAALLVAACAVTYANGVGGAFTYDDKAVIRDNPRIRSPNNIKIVFSTSYFGGPRGTGSAYRPVLLLSYAVQWWIHGKQVVGFHVVNIAIHAAVTLLLAALALRLGLAPPASAGAALLFAVHPVHVEAVTSLVGRGETLMTLFVLLYLHGAITWVRRGAPELERGTVSPPRLSPPASRLPVLVLTLLCYALALLTKESGAIAPALAFLLFAFEAEGPLGARLKAALFRGLPLYIASAALLAGLFRLRAWVLGGALRSSESGIFEVENPLAPLSPAARVANACVVLLRYLGRCLFPLHLSGDESAWSIRPFPAVSAPTVAAILLIGLLALAALARLASRSPLALGLLFFAAAFLPTANLLFPIGTVFAERLAYLPSAGICLALGAAFAGDSRDSFALTPSRKRALAVIAVLFSARAIVRNAVWWNDEALFANLIATAPRSAKAHYDAAYVAADRKSYRVAREEYARAVAIYDGYWDAWAGKGRAEKEMGLFAEAQRSYEKSIAVHSAYENGYFGLGTVREARGDDAGAEKAYRVGLKNVPQSLPLAYHLALVSGRLRRLSAAADWQVALALGGGLCSVRSDDARWLLEQGKGADAEVQARQAVRRDPSCAEGFRVLAERAASEGRRLARVLALEKAYRASKTREDLAALERAAREDATYAVRFRRLFGHG